MSASFAFPDLILCVFSLIHILWQKKLRGTVEEIFGVANDVLNRSIVFWLGRSQTSHRHMLNPVADQLHVAIQ